MDSFLQRPKAKANDKESSRNKLKDSSNISSEHNLIGFNINNYVIESSNFFNSKYEIM